MDSESKNVPVPPALVQGRVLTPAHGGILCPLGRHLPSSQEHVDIPSDQSRMTSALILPDNALALLPCPLSKLFFFFFGCLGSLLLHAGFSLVAASGGYSSLWRVGLSLGGFSCCWAWVLGMWASAAVACGLSSCGSRALERRLSSCGACA